LTKIVVLLTTQTNFFIVFLIYAPGTFQQPSM